MTIAQALKKHSQIEADLLLGHVLNKSKEFLYTNPSTKLTVSQTKQFEQMAKKRESGVPAAYLLGYKHFYGLKFKVTKSVLIPRPETEWIVDKTLKLVAQKLYTHPRTTLKILDVGTGSGCIAISIAKTVSSKNVKVFASDISVSALKLAKENAGSNKAKVSFAKRNLLHGAKGKFDLIIANLPYVPLKEYSKRYNNLKHEPKLALTDGTNNFILITKLLNQVPKHMNQNGVLLLEVDPSAISIITKSAMSIKQINNIEVVRDINGLERFVILTWA